ncbi:MAG TPA: hypothetical protein PLD95_02200 [bacterium]|nr:hypothetical protein [bacterium]
MDEKLKKKWQSLTGNSKINIPQPGDKIYVPTSLYLGHGMDDFVGGLATVSKVETCDDLPEDHYNHYMIEIEERPGTSYNLRYLLEYQNEWEEKYGDAIAHPDPDDRPEFNTWY